MKKPVLRPKVYSVQELEQLFKQPKLDQRHRAMFMTTYAAGLRVSEVCQLRIADLLSDRHQIHVVPAKGKKDRHTLLSPRLLEELRAYWRLYRPKDWLFPSRVYPERHITEDAVERGPLPLPWKPPGCRTAAASTPCATPLPRTCWKPELTH